MKHKRFQLLAVTILGLLTMPGCLFLNFGIQGSGVAVTEQRDVANFERIRLSGSADINVQCGVDKSVALTVDDNLMEIMTTEVDDGELRISSSESYSTRLGLDVDITNPSLNGLLVTGSCDAIIKDCRTESFSIGVTGSADVTVSGTTDSVNVSISGSGDVDLSEFTAKEVVISVSGSGSAIVHATEKLDVRVSGSGTVDYRGDAEVSKRISGSGSVNKLQ